MRNGQNNKRMRNRNNNNNNNNRRGQNPLTRVFESNGPDIKIRGTASHIAEKYVQLARDARSSGDPVASENYYQHAEHYFRLIAAAQEQFRQNQPQPQQPRVDLEAGEDGEEADYSNFGAEPGFVPQQQQPFAQRENRQPRDQEQPREQSLREPRGQQPGETGGVDRLPSFITGQQPSGNGFEANGHQPSEPRYPRRRRRPHGPRPEAVAAAAEDASPGNE
ncbi:MAG: DUF4167 domain-containing protein [Xanthobacteraceae bacterium]|nr:DUF4167 domain-containing protein [Xanthobacteraceae bacterium]